MADDDIKPDAEDSAEKGEEVAAEATAEGDQGAADDTAKPADAAAPSLSDSGDDGADETAAEDGAGGDGDDAVAAQLAGCAMRMEKVSKQCEELWVGVG